MELRDALGEITKEFDKVCELMEETDSWNRHNTLKVYRDGLQFTLDLLEKVVK